MSNLKQTLLVYALCLVVTIALLLSYSIAILLAGILILTGVFAFFLFAMSMLIQFGFYVNTMNKNANKQIVLTFDDGPHPEHTPAILGILDDLNVKAVFFMIGVNVKAFPEIAKEVSRRGHTIGVHSQHHTLNFGWLRGEKLANELSDCVREIKMATGEEPDLFRPPFGVTSPHIAREVEIQKLRIIGWSVRSFDTVIKSANVISKRVVGKVKDNSIVLLHDSMPLTVKALPQIIEQVRKKGLEFGQLAS